MCLGSTLPSGICTVCNEFMKTEAHKSQWVSDVLWASEYKRTTLAAGSSDSGSFSAHTFHSCQVALLLLVPQPMCGSTVEVVVSMLPSSRLKKKKSPALKYTVPPVFGSGCSSVSYKGNLSPSLKGVGENKKTLPRMLLPPEKLFCATVSSC